MALQGSYVEREKKEPQFIDQVVSAMPYVGSVVLVVLAVAGWLGLRFF